MDDGLIKAAATDPGVLLPDCILDYMVPKGIFRSQGATHHHSDTGLENAWPQTWSRIR